MQQQAGSYFHLINIQANSYSDQQIIIVNQMINAYTQCPTGICSQQKVYKQSGQVKYCFQQNRQSPQQRSSLIVSNTQKNQQQWINNNLDSDTYNAIQNPNGITPNTSTTQLDLQRILNPSQSTEQLLQNQLQQRLQSIQECITSRSNFLSFFQQMLEQEIKNNQSQRNQLQASIDQENKQGFEKNENGSRMQQLQTIQVNRKTQKINDESSKPFSERLSQTINTNLQSCPTDDKQIGSYTEQKKLKLQNQSSKPYSTLSQLRSKVYELNQQNKKLKLFVAQSFKYMKSFLINQIFKNSLNNIIEKMELNYLERYNSCVGRIEEQYNTRLDQVRRKYQERSPNDLVQLCSMNDKTQETISFRPNQTSDSGNRNKSQFQQIKKSRQVSFMQQFDCINLNMSKNKPIHTIKSKNQIKKDNNNHRYDVGKQNGNINKQNIASMAVTLKNSKHTTFDMRSQNNNMRKTDNTNKKKQINSRQRSSLLLQKKLLQDKLSSDYQDQLNEIRIKMPRFLPSLSSSLNNKSTLTHQISTQTIQIPEQKNRTFEKIDKILKLVHTIEFINIQNKKFLYKGYILGSKFHGQGTLILKDEKIVYQGQFKDGNINGKGNLTIFSQLSSYQRLSQHQYISAQNQSLQPNNCNISKYKLIRLEGSFIQNKLQNYGRLQTSIIDIKSNSQIKSQQYQIILQIFNCYCSDRINSNNIDSNISKCNSKMSGTGSRDNLIDQIIVLQRKQIYGFWKNNQLVQII